MRTFRIKLSELIIKKIIAHTAIYFLVGISAVYLFGYAADFPVLGFFLG